MSSVSGVTGDDSLIEVGTREKGKRGSSDTKYGQLFLRVFL